MKNLRRINRVCIETANYTANLAASYISQPPTVALGPTLDYVKKLGLGLSAIVIEKLIVAHTVRFVRICSIVSHMK